MTQINFTLTVDIDGAHASDVADDLGIDSEAGELDQALVNLLRQHLADRNDTRDWRIIGARVWPMGAQP